MKKFLLPACAAVALCCLTACFDINSSPTPPPPESYLESMTPEERENYEALQRAKQRIEEKNKIVPAKSHKGTQVTDKKSSLFERNSVEKRKRLGDPSKPVLLNDDESIFKWRDGGRRSDRLREKTRKESFTD